MHNFLVLNNYLSTGASYMTFVMRNQEKFDLESHDYLFNRKNFFFGCSNCENGKIENIVRELEKLDPIYLD